jgi:hypothetical protein
MTRDAEDRRLMALVDGAVSADQRAAMAVLAALPAVADERAADGRWTAEDAGRMIADRRQLRAVADADGVELSWLTGGSYGGDASVVARVARDWGVEL